MKDILPTVGKGLVYAICFWMVYKILNAILSSASSTEDQTRAAQDEYGRQQKKSAELILESEKQMKRMDTLMTKQEENARRFDAVISQLERSVSK